jgi:hypothetical protein
VDVDDVPEPDDDGVVDGVVDGVDSPPMFGQSLDECVAAFESIAAAGAVDFAADEDELVAACATAPPASRAVTAKVAMTCLERGNIFSFTSFHVVCRRSQATPCKSNLCARAEVAQKAHRTSDRARLVSQPPSTKSVWPLT